MIVVGIDVGRAIDLTAFVSLSSVSRVHTVRGLDRFTPSDEHLLDTIPRLTTFLDRFATPECPIVWDGCGIIGRKFSALIRGCPLSARHPLFCLVTTHGWRKGNQRADGIIFSPKRALVSRYYNVMNEGRLRCPPSLEWAGELRSEMSTFIEWTGPDGLPRWGAKKGRHDDLVAALVFSIWGAETLFGQGAGGFRSLSIPIDRRSYQEESRC
jgi:hypothetical protein